MYIPVPSPELTYGKEERVEWKVTGYRYFGCKEKNERNPMTQEQKKKAGKHQDMEKRRRKKHWMPMDCVPRDLR